MGGPLVSMAGVFVGRERGIGTWTQRRSCENPGRRWPSSSQAEASQEKPTLLILRSQTSSLDCEENTFPLFRPSSLWPYHYCSPRRTEASWAATLVVEMQRASLVMETLRWVSRLGKIHDVASRHWGRGCGDCAVWVQGSVRVKTRRPQALLTQSPDV